MADSPRSGGAAATPQVIIQGLNAELPKVNFGSATKLREALRKSRGDKPLLTLVMGAYLQPLMMRPLIDVLRSIGHSAELDLFLFGGGGHTETSWWVITLLRQFADRLNVIVPFQALSGMTHIAIAGDELLMSEMSVLSSVDPSRTHPLLPRDPQGTPVAVSVEDLKQCMNFVRANVGEAGGLDLGEVLTALFQHIQPLGLGALERSYSLSRDITRRALRSRQKPPPDKDIDHVVDALGGAHSHEFVLSRKEVRADLHLSVTDMPPEVAEASWALFGYYERLLNNKTDVQIASTDACIYAKGFIESNTQRRVLLQIPTPQPAAPGAQVESWVNVTEAGAVDLQ